MSSFENTKGTDRNEISFWLSDNVPFAGKLSSAA